MSTSEMVTMREAAEGALRLLERWTVTIDGEWGGVRSLEEIEADGDLPKEIVNLRRAIAEHDATIQGLINHLNSEGNE